MRKIAKGLWVVEVPSNVIDYPPAVVAIDVNQMLDLKYRIEEELAEIQR